MVQQANELAELSAATVRAWIALAAEVLSHNAELLNGLNVFPVADSDTGSNLAASMRGAAVAISELPDANGLADSSHSVQELLATAARGALRAGRGNSGVILSEWLRGFAQAYQKSPNLAAALGQAARSATEAVAKPAPGTILTAAQAAAEAVKGATENCDDEAAAAVYGARQAAKDSPASLAALAKAGVPDAGACGLVLVLAALQAVLAGQRDYEQVSLGFDPFDVPAVEGGAEGAWVEGDDADEDGFEVMFTLRRPANATEFQTGQVAVQLRKDLAEIGNSVVVVGGLAVGDENKDSEWHAHVHVAEVADALALIARWRKNGVIASIQVRHLAVPAGELNAWVTTSDPALIAEYARSGAVVLVPSEGQSTAEAVVSAVKASPTTANIVLGEPEDVAAISEGLTYPTDLILGPPNPAAEALLLMAIGDQVGAGNELDAARETAGRLVTASSGVGPEGLPPAIKAAASSGLVVATVPDNEPPHELELARADCEAVGAELVVIERGDTEPVIYWATENSDGQ